MRPYLFQSLPAEQTTNNPSPESTLKGWMLMGVVAGAFAPSKVRLVILLASLQGHLTTLPSFGSRSVIFSLAAHPLHLCPSPTLRILRSLLLPHCWH